MHTDIFYYFIKKNKSHNIVLNFFRPVNIE